VLREQLERRGASVKDRLIASLPDYAARAARWAPVLNLRNRWPWLARWGEAWLGFSAQRTLPEWQRQHFFNTPHQTATRAEVLAAQQGVVLFVDTFNGYFESEVAQAAVQVLQAAGYTVHVAARDDALRGHLCCGRTYLSTGHVAKARAKAQELLGYLAPLAQRGLPIVGLEPSCLLSMRDEWLAMGLGGDARTLADQALLLEEFLARELKAGRLQALQEKLQPLAQPLLVHGHCHQKAFGVVQPVLEVLRMIPGAQPTLIDSSCCGMAGSFGYEASHYDVSMQMAELSLLPAIRAQADAIVVADGTSCRHQIADGAGRQAVHVASVLAQALNRQD
jgi:Fe-S oxidoreductase